MGQQQMPEHQLMSQSLMYNPQVIGAPFPLLEWPKRP